MAERVVRVKAEVLESGGELVGCDAIDGALVVELADDGGGFVSGMPAMALMVEGPHFFARPVIR